MIGVGVPLPLVAKIVGWSASTIAKMAARYGHFGFNDLRYAVEAIGRVSPQEGNFEAGSLESDVNRERRRPS